MQKSLIFLSGCAVQAFAAEPLLRFQGTSVSVDATAPAATPTVDPSTQTAGLPFKQKLNIGEKTPLSPAMQSVLCLVALYYAVILVTFVLDMKKELANITNDDAAPPVTAAAGTTALVGDKKADGVAEKAEKQLRQILADADATCKLIPMVAILIVFARLRAKVDLEGTNPSDTCRKSFFAIVGIMYTQAFFAAIFGCIQSFVGENGMLTKFKNLMKFLLTFGLYTCIVVIFHAIISQVKTAAE
jgi:hypothetical protein